MINVAIEILALAKFVTGHMMLLYNTSNNVGGWENENPWKVLGVKLLLDIVYGYQAVAIYFGVLEQEKKGLD